MYHLSLRLGLYLEHVFLSIIPAHSSVFSSPFYPTSSSLTPFSVLPLPPPTTLIEHHIKVTLCIFYMWHARRSHPHLSPCHLTSAARATIAGREVRHSSLDRLLQQSCPECGPHRFHPQLSMVHSGSNRRGRMTRYPSVCSYLPAAAGSCGNFNVLTCYVELLRTSGPTRAELAHKGRLRPSVLILRLNMAENACLK